MRNLANTRIICLAPATGTSGVGDYADDFLGAIRPHFGQVVEIRHGGPGEDRIVDCFRIRRQLKSLLRDPAWPETIVHSELSGGAFLPFWVTARLKATLNTATLHDPPYGVWQPYRSRLIARSWFWTHSVHFPTMKFNERLERRILKGRPLFVLTKTGANAARSTLRTTRVHECSLIESQRPDLRPAEDRPMAVGLFGYAYRTKGLEMISALRELIDGDIAIRVAGRGTENLPQVPGVDILGEVNDAAEDAYFGSIRLLVMPYGERLVYGRPVFAASSVMHRAISYQTPVLWASASASDRGDGIATVALDPAHIATTINVLLRDHEQLSDMGKRVRNRRSNQSTEAVIAPFLDVWAGRVE